MSQADDPIPIQDYVRLRPQLTEFSTTAVSMAISDAAEGEPVPLADPRSGEVTATIHPDVAHRAREAIEAGAVLLAPRTGEEPNRTIVALFPDGSARYLTGCREAAEQLVTDYASATEGLDTPADVWRAFADESSGVADDFGAYVDDLLAGSPEGWLERDPDLRQIVPGETPDSVLDELGTGLVIVDLGTYWENLDGSVCLRTRIAWGECAWTGIDGPAAMIAYIEDSSPLELWLLETDSFEGNQVLLHTFGASDAAQMAAADRAERKAALVKPLVDAATFSELASLVFSDEEVLAADVTSFDDVERYMDDHTPAAEPVEGP